MTTLIPVARRLEQPRIARLAALLAGAVLAAAFSPLDFYPLALLSPALMIHLWLCARSPRDAAWIGFSFGMGLFVAGVSWIYVSLSLFGGMPATLAGLATLAFCAWLALLPAAVGYLQQRIPAAHGARALLVIPALWMLFESLRGWYLTGFPWLTLGYATTDTPLAGYAAICGVFGVSLITMICAALVRQSVCGPRRMPALGGLLIILAVGGMLQKAEWTRPYGLPLSVSLLQGNISQQVKFDPDRYEKTLSTYRTLASGSDARLIVLPETALPRFLDRIDPYYLSELQSIARRNGGDLLLGVPYRSDASSYFNSVISLGTSPSQIYSKTHLVPFGEFIPPGFGWISSVLQVPLSDFSRGNREQIPFKVAGQRIAINICYEDAFGEEIIRPLPEATLLANVSNVAWFGDSLAPGQHLQIARMRTLETGRAMLAATNTGITAAIDRDGRILGRLPQFMQGRLDVSVRGYEGMTPYARTGNWPALLVSALLIALSVAGRKR